MANPKMKDAGYWYGDEDCNAFVGALRQEKGLADDCDFLLKDPINGFHAVVLNVVNGQEGADADARNLESRLNKNTRLEKTPHLVLLSELCNVKEELTPEFVHEFLQKHAAARKLDPNAASSLYSRAEELKFNKEALKKHFNEQAVQAVGKDPFDDMSTRLQENNAKFKIEFHVNSGGKFDPTKTDSGIHWTLGEIEIVKTGKKIKVDFYNFDSVKTGSQFSDAEFRKAAAAVTTRLKETLGDDIEVVCNNCVNPYPVHQFNGSDCGPHASHNLSLRLENKDLGLVKHNMREEQFNLASKLKKLEIAVPKKEAADKNGKWNDHSIQKVKETFNEVFKGVKAELVDDTIKTTDLSDANLKVLVEKTKELMDKLGLKGSVEINVSPETKRTRLEELCRKHKLDFTSNAKEAAPAIAEPARRAGLTG